MIEFAATLYAIETLLSWVTVIAVFTFISIIVYKDYRWEQKRKQKE